MRAQSPSARGARIVSRLPINAMLRNYSLAVLALTSAPLAAEAEDFRVEASVNSKKIGLDDALELTLAIHGDATGRAGAPKLPKLDGFRLSGQSQSTSIQWINGQMSASRSITYTLVPQSEGKHVLGAIAVPYGGKEYLTEPIEVEVVKGSVAPQGRSGAADPFDTFPFRQRPRARPQEPVEIFVTAELSPESAYVGQQVVLTYKLFTPATVAGIDLERGPQLTGFWVENVPPPVETHGEVKAVDGKKFTVFDVKKSYLFPAKEGKVVIEPATFIMAVRDSADPFRQSDAIRRSTKAVTLDVKPLPQAGRPKSFSGAVGEFRLDAKLDKDRVPAGSPLTLSITLSGSGNVKTAAPPALPPLVDFKTYPPKVEDSVKPETSGFRAQKKWEHVLVPNSVGKQNLGPVRFAYFNPATERYVEVETSSLSVEVDRPTDVATGLVAPSPRSEVKLLRRDVRYLKPAPRKLGVVAGPYHRSAVFYSTLALPFLWNLGLVFYRLKLKRETSEVGAFRGRRARRRAFRTLKLASKKARSGRQDFYEVASGALSSYVADKLNVSASGLTTAQIDSALSEQGVPAQVRADLLKTLETCEFARFTPGQRTRTEMEGVLRAAEGAILSVEKHLP